MVKSQTMLDYEATTGKPSTRWINDGVHTAGIEVWHYDYINHLEAIAIEHDAIPVEGIERVTLEFEKSFMDKLRALIVASCSNYRGSHSRELPTVEVYLQVEVLQALAHRIASVKEK